MQVVTKFKKDYFVGTRPELNKLINESIDNINHMLMSVSLEDTDQQNLYQYSVLVGQLTYTLTIKSLLIDPTIKTWLIRDKHARQLGFNDFKLKCESLRDILNKQPPQVNYSRLVIIQTILSLLTRMEF